MSSNLYNLYISGIYEIAQTLLYKHDLTAQAVNKGVVEKGYPVNYNDRSTWKYYLNMAGLYHQSDKDIISSNNSNGSPYMQIKIASDTGSIDVDFTESLLNPLTGNITIANEYQYNGYLYNELLTRYPEHEELILGILNPIPLSVSLNAQDGDILYCGGYKRTVVTDALGVRVSFTKLKIDGLNDKQLIEDNEIDIINDVESFIKNYLTRWHNPDYPPHHNLYCAVMTGIIASHIPSVIFNARLKRIHSSETHSFLMREYFESKGRLDKYTSNLPLKERLYLYRNLRNLTHGVGKQESFKAIVDNIATPLRIPLAGYTLRHNLTQVPENILPNPVIRREVINFRQVGTGREAVDIHNLLHREIPIAKDNGFDIDNVELSIEERVQSSGNNRLPTKIVDSQMLDLSDSGVFPLARVIYDLWVYGVFTNTYKGVIYITNPATGDRISLTPKNALILAIFCYSKAYTGNDLVNIPSMSVSMIPRSAINQLFPSFPLLPNSALLKQSINSDYIGLPFCVSMLGQPYEIPLMTSTDQFYREATKIHNEIKRRYTLCVKQLDAKARSRTEYGMSTLYWLNMPVVISNQTYVDWFAQTGISVSGLSPESYVNISTEIIRQISGNRPNNSQLIKEIQDSVIGLLKHFSSYTTQFISSINNASTIVTARRGIRGTNIKEKMADKIRMRSSRFVLRKVDFKAKDATVIPSTIRHQFTE